MECWVAERGVVMVCWLGTSVKQEDGGGHCFRDVGQEGGMEESIVPECIRGISGE